MFSNAFVDFLNVLLLDSKHIFCILHYVSYTDILINAYMLNNVINAEFNHKKYIYLNAFYTELKDQISVFLK